MSGGSVNAWIGFGKDAISGMKDPLGVYEITGFTYLIGSGLLDLRFNCVQQVLCVHRSRPVTTFILDYLGTFSNRVR